MGFSFDHPSRTVICLFADEFCNDQNMYIYIFIESKRININTYKCVIIVFVSEFGTWVFVGY